MKQRSRISPLLIAGLTLLMFLSLLEALSLFGTGRVHSNDFKHLWLGTRVLIEGGSPYDAQLLLAAARQFGIDSINPYVYLPATGLFLWPFGKMSYAGGVIAWFAVNWLIAWGVVLAGPSWVRLDRSWRAQLLGALFIVGSMPFVRQMTAGQMNLVVLGALVLAWGWLIRGRDVSAGVTLGLAAAFKIAPFFFLLALLGLRRWKAAAGLLLGFAAANFVALLAFGFDVHRDAVPVLTQMGYGESTWAEFGMDFYRDPFNQSFNALFHHLLTENPYTTPWVQLSEGLANGLTLAVSLLMLGGFAWLLWRGTSASTRQHDETADQSMPWSALDSLLYLLAILLMLLLPSLLWDHYALQALPILFWIACPREGSDSGPGRWIILGAAFILLSIPWMHLSESYREGFGVLLMSIRLWGLVLVAGFLAVEAIRATRHPASEHPNEPSVR